MADRTSSQNRNCRIFTAFSIGQSVGVADGPDNLAVRIARASDARGLSAGRAVTIRKSRMVPTIRWHRTVQPHGNKEISLGNCRAALVDHRAGPANATAQATELLAMTVPDKSRRSRQRYQTILADEKMLGCRFQLFPAMNPATVAGIGPFIGPRFEGKLSLSQVESTAEEDSVIQDFRITAAETMHLGEEYRKAWSGETIRKSQMVPVIRWLRITQPAEIKVVFRCNCHAGFLDYWEATAQVAEQATEQVVAFSKRRYQMTPARVKRFKETL